MKLLLQGTGTNRWSDYLDNVTSFARFFAPSRVQSCLYTVPVRSTS